MLADNGHRRFSFDRSDDAQDNKEGIALHEPIATPEAYMLAIVHKYDETKQHMQLSPSIRYFTLEKSCTKLRMLFGRNWEGTHSTYREGPEPEASAFAQAVVDRVAV